MGREHAAQRRRGAERKQEKPRKTHILQSSPKWQMDVC
jgi:hypothetical protein